MTTVVILAGGKSERMGQDKETLILGGVERIQKLVNQIGEYRIITLCGDKERETLFSGEVWPDQSIVDLPCSCY